MKTLVVGANGFLGGHVVRALVGAGREVRVMVRRTSRTVNIEGLPVECVFGDLLDPKSIDQALGGCDVVYNCALNPRTWVPNPAIHYRVNLEGARNLLRAAAQSGVSCLVFTSTVGTIGHGPTDIATETNAFDWWREAPYYIRTRVLAEQQVERFVRKGLRVIIVNPSTTIGAWDHQPTPQGQFVLSILRRRAYFYYDLGIDVVNCADVARGMLLAEQKGRSGERYILGNQYLTLAEIGQLVARLARVPPPRWRLPVVGVTAAAGVLEVLSPLFGSTPEVSRAAIRIPRLMPRFDWNKARQELGYNPGPIEEAFVEAIDWFRRSGYVERCPSSTAPFHSMARKR